MWAEVAQYIPRVMDKMQSRGSIAARDFTSQEGMRDFVKHLVNKASIRELVSMVGSYPLAAA